MSQLICTQCGAELRQEEILYVGDEIVCPSCAETDTTVCSYCGERIWRENDANWCTPENLRKLCAEHRNIANAFRSRSPEEAYSAIRNHLRKV